MDRCLKSTASGIVVRSCNNAAGQKLLGITGDGCKTISGATTCYCSTNSCNGDQASGRSDASSGAETSTNGKYLLTYDLLKDIPAFNKCCIT